jgi:tRNA G10  N-methylase Trm11
MRPATEVHLPQPAVDRVADDPPYGDDPILPEATDGAW